MGRGQLGGAVGGVEGASRSAGQLALEDAAAGPAAGVLSAMHAIEAVEDQDQEGDGEVQRTVERAEYLRARFGGPVPRGPLPLVVASEPADGCETGQGRWAGAAVLVSRGGCSFERKQEVAIAAGARAVLVSNSGPGLERAESEASKRSRGWRERNRLARAAALLGREVPQEAPRAIDGSESEEDRAGDAEVHRIAA